MAVWKFACKTIQGMNLDLKLVSRGNLPLKLTKSMNGAGRISPTQLMTLSDIIEPVQDLQIQDAVERIKTGVVKIPVLLKNNNVAEKYDMHQLGIYAEDPDLGEILYMILQSDSAEEIPASAEIKDFTLEWYINLSVGNTQDVEVVIDETCVLTTEQADARYVAQTGDTSNTTTKFVRASTRENIASGEKLSVILGKVMKWFADLKTVAFSGKYTDLTDKPTIPAAVRVKGNAESAYRTGDVNLTAENVGLGNVDNTADANKNVATANQVNGVYTGNGGQQPPSYVTSGKTRFNMMNAFKGFTNPAGGYMDVILMDNYAGGDVPYVTGIGVTKNNGNPRMFIANGEKGSTGNWAHQVEVITSSNVSSQNVAYSTKATQDSSGNNIVNTYAKKSIYGDTTVSLGRKSGTISGSYSFVLGDNNAAEADWSSALGGNDNVSSGNYSAVLGGYENTASGYQSVVTGGSKNTASGNYSAVLGGYENTVSGSYSAAMGYRLLAESDYSTVCGRHNARMASQTAFVVGNGVGISQLSNAFSVMFNGTVKAKSTITGSTTADYAEFFEWLDGNPNNEDRVGRFVTLTGNKITIANSNSDYILGIVSGEPFVLGNGDCDTWNGMYMKDDFNRTIYEPAPKIELNEETGERVPVVDEGGNPVYEGTRPKLNPEYDPDQPYISRFERKEWAPVGMLGVLSVIDDGSCQVDGFCCCSTDGSATACEKETEGACRVIERVSKNVVRVVLK